MSDNNLFVYLDMVRAELREIKTDDDWEKAKLILSKHGGGTRAYIPTSTIEKKRGHLEKITQFDAHTCPAVIARNIGISVRRVQQLKKLID